MEDVTRLSRCARCGAPLAADADAGLCAACATAVTEARTVLLAATPDVPGDDLTVAGPRGGQIAGGDAATVLATRTIPPRPARSPKLGPGQMFGPYRIERLLGRGGMGEVYEAEHVEHGRRLALKVLTGHFAGPEDRARFLREGELAASINDPNTVYVYGSEEIDGAPVITMELLPGGWRALIAWAPAAVLVFIAISRPVFMNAAAAARAPGWLASAIVAGLVFLVGALLAVLARPHEAPRIGWPGPSSCPSSAATSRCRRKLTLRFSPKASP